MIKIALVGDIGSGKSYIANLFNYPIFNADAAVANIYKNNKICFSRIKKRFPKYISSFPIKKKEITKIILTDSKNVKHISKIIHPIVRKKMNLFLKKNKNKKIVILDVPLYLENKLNKKNDIIIFIQSKKTEILKRLHKRKGFNIVLIKKLKKIQLSLENKKKKSNFVIKNNFTKKNAKRYVKYILNKILS